MARRVTGRSSAELESFAVESLVGAGVNAAVMRAQGLLHEGAGTVPFSVVRKAIRGGDDGMRGWEREAAVYTSGLLAELEGVEAPTLLDRRDDADGHGTVLWLEDVVGETGPWTLERFELVARALGRFGAPFATGVRAVPDAEWLSQGWLEDWIEMAASAFDEFEEAATDPLLRRLYPPEIVEGVRRLWDARHRVLAALRTAPEVLGHLDASPANTIISGDRVVLLDWAFTGRAALGEDLGCLVGASSLFARPPVAASDLPAIMAAAFPAYLDGLADGGWRGDPTYVRFVVAASTALRYCVGGTAFMVKGIGVDGPPPDGTGIRDPDQRAMQERMVGRPFEEILDVCAATFRYLILDLAEEALTLLPTIERSH